MAGSRYGGAAGGATTIAGDVEAEEAVASKERLVVRCGFRTWRARPIFSELSVASDRQKFERWLQPARWACASAFGPITFSPACPVLLQSGVCAQKMYCARCAPQYLIHGPTTTHHT